MKQSKRNQLITSAESSLDSPRVSKPGLDSPGDGLPGDVPRPRGDHQPPYTRLLVLNRGTLSSDITNTYTKQTNTTSHPITQSLTSTLLILTILVSLSSFSGLTMMLPASS